jgi:C_GCAxxG_C_C family probable redox protein
MDFRLTPEQAARRATEYFSAEKGRRFNCAESVLLALVESMGREAPLVPRIATTFGGGVGGSHALTCGALSGAVIATGVAFGRDRPGDDRVHAEHLVQQLLEAFRLEFGAVNCHELLRLPPDTPNWRETARALGVHETMCERFVRFAARRWLELASA